MPVCVSSLYLPRVHRVYLALILDLFSPVFFLKDGKGLYLPLGKSGSLDLKVDFLAKCCQEDNSLGKQINPTVHWSVHLTDHYTYQLWLFSLSLHIIPLVSKERLAFCELECQKKG